MPHFGDPAGLGEKTAGAISVNVGGAAGVAVSPTVSAATKALQDLDAGASNLLVGFRVTAGATDDVVASERLSNGTPATVQAGADSSIVISLAEAVSRVDVVGIMNGTATGNCINHTDSVANAAAQGVQFDFSPAVKKVVVSMLPTFNTVQESQLSVEGYQYA